MSGAEPIADLVRALQGLPGVGVKSASRMAYHLLHRDRAAASALARALDEAVARVGHCEWCNTLSETAVCATCQAPDRDSSLLCVVETPADQAALERTGVFKGRYFVLMGKVSPLDGIGPRDIGLQRLMTRVLAGVHGPAPDEVILATNFTAEGEATAHVVTQLLRTQDVKVTRLARGVPIGSELEYVDLGTIAHAMNDRR